MADEPRCACGKPLHYSNSYTRFAVSKLVAMLGENIEVRCAGRRYRVQRHYIALHGLQAWELPALAEKGIVKEERDEEDADEERN